MTPVFISDETYNYLVKRGCFVEPITEDQPLNVQRDAAAVRLAAARCDRDSLQYERALRDLGDNLAARS